MIEPNKVVATSALNVLLGATGMGMFAWMAATNWKDITGVIIGVIFIILSIVQVLFSLRWYRAVKGVRQEYELPVKEMAELREKAGPPSKGPPTTRESAAPLLKNRESALESAAATADANNAKVTEAESQG